MMLNRGELDGMRLLGRKTVELMTSNHLAATWPPWACRGFPSRPMRALASVSASRSLLDPARAQIVGTPGEYAWGGAASTAFWIDPAEEMIVILLTQLVPSSTYPLRRELRVLAYQAIVD